MEKKELKKVLNQHDLWLNSNHKKGKRVNLTRANLRGANLRGAYLTGAYLTGVNLTRANLTRANLRGANLRGANLTRANLTGADLTGAKSILSIGPGGSRMDILYAVKHDKCIMVKAGCFWGSIDEFEKAVKKTHKENDHSKYYNAVITMIRVWG